MSEFELLRHLLHEGFPVLLHKVFVFLAFLFGRVVLELVNVSVCATWGT